MGTNRLKEELSKLASAGQLVQAGRIAIGTFLERGMKTTSLQTKFRAATMNATHRYTQALPCKPLQHKNRTL